jgi:small subunit ribosomal protein S9
MAKTLNVSGSRKKAIARASIKEGKGTIRINKQNINTMEPEISRLRLQEPLEIAKDYASNVDIDLKVHGGGSQSQIEAARLERYCCKAVFMGHTDLIDTISKFRKA